MTVTAHVTPDTELFSAFEAKAQAATMETYTALLEELAAYTINDVFDPVQRTLLIVALGNNKTLGVGKRAAGNALAAVEKAAKRATQAQPDGIQGGRGIYLLEEHGVDFRKPVKDGYADAVTICAPLRVLAETYDTAAGNNGRLLEWVDSRGRVKTWAMPSEVSAGDGMEIIKTLLSRGLQMRYGNDKEVIDYIMSSPVDDLMTCTDRTGWVNGVYITPQGAHGEHAESYIYQPLHTVESKIGQAGTLTDWQAHIARYAQNNPLLMTAISLAFAGTLLNKAGMMGYGLHIFGGSSSGKTTMLQVAASVWGYEFWNQWLATSVGIEGSAHAHNDNILCLDEIGEATAQTVSATAYALANGESKRRGGRDGNAKATKKWRLVFFSTGEYSLDHMMKAAGMVTRAGQEVRMINIKAESWQHGGFRELHSMANGSEFSETLKANTARYYGTAGDAWLDAITAPGGIPDTIVSDIDEIRDSLLPDGANGQVRRVARQFAVTAYAGELATRYNITGWKAGEATAAAKECFNLWLDGFGGADGNRETRQIIEAVQSFLTRHYSKFQDLRLTSPLPVHDRAGFVDAGATGDNEFLIPSTELHRIAEGYSREQIITALRTAGMINEPDKQGKAAVKIQRGAAKGRFFVVQPTPPTREGEPAPT